jgi:hypothetical protein
VLQSRARAGGEGVGGRGGSRIGAGAGHRAGETDDLVSDLRSRLSKVSCSRLGISVFEMSAAACIQTLFAERVKECSMP